MVPAMTTDIDIPTEAVLRLNDFRTETRLGCTPPERVHPQPIRFDLVVRFRKIPEGCRTDSIDDTVCYSKVSDALRSVCVGGEFHLIEKVAFDALQKLRTVVDPYMDLELTATKLHPPVEGLQGGVSFTLRSSGR